jgi:uncharacterized protein (TIGR03790 family)
MSVTLTQTTPAAFPDRPTGSGRGLRVTLDAGLNGAYVERALGAGQTVLHCRMMVHVDGAAGGSVVIARGADLQGAERFRIALAADSAQIELESPLGEKVVAPLPPGLAWHGVEARIDADGGGLSLWLNGRPVGSATGVAGLGPMHIVAFGGIVKHAALTGTVDLDEIIIADDYIGPASVEPAGEFADDPARWLVVYNAQLADSVAWAQAYRDARAVPYANLLGLDPPTTETITQSQFEDIRDAVEAYLSDNGLGDQVAGILIGHGVPGRYTRDAGGTASVAAQLQKIDGSDDVIANQLAQATLPDRPTRAAMLNTRMTARIDGPALADSIALQERAAAIEATGLGDGLDATIWLDAVTIGGAYGPRQQKMLDWAQSIDRQRLRLPLEQTQPTDPPTDEQFAQIAHDGFFLGWRQSAPPAGFFAQPAGRRVFAMQMTDLPATAPTLRDAQHESWAIRSLQAGYAAAAGSSDISYIEAAPLPGPFFAALEAGWTLAEAWYVASVLLRTNSELIGDPLMRVAIPRAGWDLFGPFDDWASVRFDEPVAHLREEERSWDVPVDLQPVGDRGLYIVRHVDDQGRDDGSVRHVVLQPAQGQWVAPPIAPAWPAPRGWRPRRSAAGWEIEAHWPVAFGRAGVRQVQLVAEPQGEPEFVVATRQVAETDRACRFTWPQSGVPTRLFIRATGAAGGTVTSPPSAWLTPSQRPIVPLTSF